MGKDFSNELSSVLAGGADTIVARATPTGRGALAIVRLSGPGVSSIIRLIFANSLKLAPWKATLVDIHGVDGEMIEKVVVIFYRAPRSFTGEDMLEIMCHGSSFIIQEIIRACVRAGAREALPGEFTRRAVINGKMDLVQAEGVRDMIDAETRWQARVAREQMNGALSREMTRLRKSLIKQLALLEVDLDFSEAEVGIDRDVLEEGRTEVLELIDNLLATHRFSENIRDGLRVVIVGPPNAGKSTLFNRLVCDERAIVSPHPGTTRDLVEAQIDISGIPVVLVDTAGLRETVETIEAEGVKRTQSAIAGADCILVLSSAEDPEQSIDLDVFDTAGDSTGGRTVVEIVQILTKCDLRDDLGETQEYLQVSALSGQGVETLIKRLEELVNRGIEDFGGQIAIASRHRHALREARRCVSTEHRDPEVAAEEIRWALRSVEDLIGQTDDEHVFDEVFSGFCIGK